MNKLELSRLFPDDFTVRDRVKKEKLMAETIKVKRTIEEERECEIFTFPTDKDRKEFIKDLKAHDPEYPYAVNMDPDESEPERYLVAVPIERYNFVTQGDKHGH